MDNCDCQLSDVSMLTEDALLDPSVANAKLAKKKLKIEKIVTMKESTNNLLCG